MYELCFNGVTVAHLTELNAAIGLAINLHKSSNVDHKVTVSLNGELILNLFVSVPPCEE